ncbi:exonuclease domain-containing protein [Priestia abyssalis]|uniref:exonuclease domain-containing protein n=1 Tax=Priestia abyssalis TaxID=1221450 RepID=UPI00099598D7|nr:exonuclease domain-containing protein [Priestia abyssalis]
MPEKNVQLAAILDIETTGLSPHDCDIIEAAIILFSYDAVTGEVLEIVEEYSGFNMPSSPISPFITRLTGITNKMVQNEKLDDAKIMALLQQAHGIIAHNASFDRSFLLKRYPVFAEKRWHCSMRSVKWKDYGFMNKKLDTLLEGHSIVRKNAHRAMDDVKATLQLLQSKNPHDDYYLLEVMKKAMSKPKGVLSPAAKRG